MLRTFSKSQAAFEFLTTYGWAFLVILIMIGTLAYFGILNPSKFLPSRCNFSPEFQCQDYQISATANTLRVRLKNNIDTMSITSMVTGSESANSYSCTLITPSLPFTFASGNISNVQFDNCNSAAAGFVSGEKAKVSVKITYNTVASGSNYDRQVNGEIYTTVV
ncbi:MAG TPA: hypothetical protein VJJ52_06420 [Candidatus Nanoarchaeia archaeon]|nr:hypothetical protein [Candidatus Nanoarchaeia archaeon]